MFAKQHCTESKIRRYFSQTFIFCGFKRIRELKNRQIEKNNLVVIERKQTVESMKQNDPLKSCSLSKSLE